MKYIYIHALSGFACLSCSGEPLFVALLTCYFIFTFSLFTYLSGEPLFVALFAACVSLSGELLFEVSSSSPSDSPKYRSYIEHILVRELIPVRSVFILAFCLTQVPLLYTHIHKHAYILISQTITPTALNL